MCRPRPCCKLGANGRQQIRWRIWTIPDMMHCFDCRPRIMELHGVLCHVFRDMIVHPLAGGVCICRNQVPWNSTRIHYRSDGCMMWPAWEQASLYHAWNVVDTDGHNTTDSHVDGSPVCICGLVSWAMDECCVWISPDQDACWNGAGRIWRTSAYGSIHNAHCTGTVLVRNAESWTLILGSVRIRMHRIGTYFWHVLYLPTLNIFRMLP